MEEPPTLECNSKHTPIRHLPSTTKKKARSFKSCEGGKCHIRRSMTKIEKMQDDGKDPALKKVYNLITINVFH